MMYRYFVTLKYLVFLDSHWNFEFEGKIKFITVTYLQYGLRVENRAQMASRLSPGCPAIPISCASV
jgi:hypothetical protein